MSSNNEMNMNTLEPDAPSAASPQPGRSKALRADTKGDGEGNVPVFRLDALAPGAGQDGASQIPTPANAKISHAAIFFLVLIVGGGALLFVMRRIGINPMSAIAKMQEPEVDLTKNGKGAVDHTRVLRDLSESAVKGQVPIEQVQKNPFEIPEVAVPDADPDKAKRLADEKARKEAETYKQRLETALAGLKVHGIINGTVPVARINDQAVRVGDKVDSFFTVKAIAGRNVEVEADGQIYVISLDDNTGPVKKSTSKKK